MDQREENDFIYLLELMPVLHNVPEFAWLPELFSIIGAERLISLCKYAGGEIIKIPTIEELSLSIAALQLYYDIDIKHIDKPVPENLSQLYDTIKTALAH